MKNTALFMLAALISPIANAVGAPATWVLNPGDAFVFEVCFTRHTGDPDSLNALNDDLKNLAQNGSLTLYSDLRATGRLDKTVQIDEPVTISQPSFRTRGGDECSAVTITKQ